MLYARYNRQRQPAFQTATLILQSEKTWVLKKILHPDAQSHLQQMRTAQALLEKHKVSPSVSYPALLENLSTDTCLAFEYIDAFSISELLCRAWRKNDKASFWQALDLYREALNSFGSQKEVYLSPLLRNIFGFEFDDQLQTCGPCGKITLLDASPANILLQTEKRFFIDNEWVFEGSLPLNFILYRNLFHFFKINQAPNLIENFISFESVLQRYRITPEEVRLYQNLEKCFQAYVFGQEPGNAFLKQYLQPAYLSVEAMSQTVKILEQQVKGQAETIDIMLNSLGWRMLEKMRRFAAKIAPPDSWRRRAGEKIRRMCQKL